MVVIKRDGVEAPFELQKIINAIKKANEQVDFDQLSDESIKNIALEIEEFYTAMNIAPHVEEIQDLVETNLMAIGAYDVAREYVRYRYKREMARDNYTVFMDAIAEKLEARNPANQNANVDEKSFGGRIGEAASIMSKQYALDNLISPMAKTNHLKNRIYIHDLDSYAVGSHNCLTIPFDDLLAKGFNTRQTDVRPAQSVSTAFQLVAVIFQLQSLCQFGGVSASHLDWTMVPYVRKSFYKHYKDGLKYFVKENSNTTFYISNPEDYSIEKTSWTEDESGGRKYFNAIYDIEEVYNYAMDMTVKEVYQAVEGMYHNLK